MQKTGALITRIDVHLLLNRQGPFNQNAR